MANQSIAKKMTTGVIWSYAERFLAQLITLVVSIVLARILDPEHYGTVAVVTVFITICDALVTGGFGNALVQKKDATDTDFNTICWFSIALAAVLYVILFFCAPIIAAIYKDDILVIVTRVMGVKFIFSAFNCVQQAYVQRKMMFKKFFFATLTGTLASAVVGIWIAINGGGVWALVAQYLTNTIIDTVFLYATIDWKPRFEFSKDSFNELWGFGAKMLASTMVFTVRDNIRSLVVGKKFSTTDLAYYNHGKKFPQLAVTDIVSSLGKVLFPALSEKQEHKEESVKIMRRSVSLSSYVLSPVIIGLIAVANVFVISILTQKWLPAVPYLRILCLVYITRSINTVFQKGILSIGHSEQVLYYEIGTSSATLLLLFIAAFIFNSITLIAWSYVVIEILGTLYYAFCVRNYFGYTYKEMVIDYFPSIIMSLIMAAVVLLIGKTPIAPIAVFIIQVIAGIFVYVILSIISKNKDFKYLCSYISKATEHFGNKNK